MTDLFWSRWHRWWVSASSVLAAGLSAAGLIGLTKDLSDWIYSGSDKSGPIWSIWIAAALLVGGLFIFVRSHAEYRKRTFDPKWISEFSKQFGEESMMKARALASQTLIDRQGKLRTNDITLDNIDDVLDFWDEVGFYVYGDQITPEFAHQTFSIGLRDTTMQQKIMLNLSNRQKARRLGSIFRIYSK